MKLLILTQKVNKKDSVLGFFHGWILALSKHYEEVHVICLEKGEYELPSNVFVYSLGKEEKQSRLQYVFRFYKYIWILRNRYDVVFVHMNQEYVLLGSLIWKLLNKNVFMWRNHYAGTGLTRLAGRLSQGVFCTSKFSFTASFPNTKIMPVGVDESSARMDESIERVPGTILFLGRLDISKNPDVLIKALGLLKKEGLNFKTSFVGGMSNPDSLYQKELEELARDLSVLDDITFVGAVPNTETFRYYRSHEIFVNCSKSGMFDKTIFKACACGCLVLATSRDFKDLAGEQFSFSEGSHEELAKKMKYFFNLPDKEKIAFQDDLKKVIQNHSLPVLIGRLVDELQ